MIRRSEITPRTEGAAQLADMLAHASLETIAKRAGVGKDSLRRYLDGKTKPTATSRKRMKSKLGIDPKSWDVKPKKRATILEAHFAQRARGTPAAANFAPAPTPPATDDTLEGSELSAISAAAHALRVARRHLDHVESMPDGPLEIPRALKALNDAIATYARIRGEFAPPETTLTKSPQFARYQQALFAFLVKVLTPDQFDELGNALEKLL